MSNPKFIIMLAVLACCCCSSSAVAVFIMNSGGTTYECTGGQTISSASRACLDAGGKSCSVICTTPSSSRSSGSSS